MLFQQGFQVEEPHELHHNIPNLIHPGEEGAEAAYEVERRHIDCLRPNSHRITSRGKKQPPSPIATHNQISADPHLHRSPVHPRVWNLQQYESFSRFGGDASVCSTPPLTASTGSLPEWNVTDLSPCASMFADAEASPDRTPHPFTPTFQPAAISSPAFTFRRGHQSVRSDYGQMFSPRNNLGYLTSLQGNQSCIKRNTELAELFVQMQNDFFDIVQVWPYRDGQYISKIGPDIDMRCIRWERKFENLIAETIDYSKLDLLDDSTARIALETCAACLLQDIPRDSIYRIIWELRQVLAPGVEYDDWCRHAPDLSGEDETYEQYATGPPRGMTASSSHGYYIPDNDPRSPGTAGISDIDSELNFNVVFDD